MAIKALSAFGDQLSVWLGHCRRSAQTRASFLRCSSANLNLRLEADRWRPSLLQILRVLRHLLACFQADVRFLPVGAVAGELSATPLLAGKIGRAHRVHFHLEDSLHGLLDLGLAGTGR